MLENHSNSSLLFCGSYSVVLLGLALSRDLSGEAFFIFLILVYLFLMSDGDSPPF